MILCQGRTGSSHLVSLLDSHPDVRCFGELFTNDQRARGPLYRSSGHDDVHEYAAELTVGIDARAVGLKLPVNSVRAHPASLTLLEDRELRVIRLFRRNLLAQYVSRRLQNTTGVGQSLWGSYGDTRVRLDPATCLEVFESMGSQERMLDDAARHNPVRRLAYEDLVAGRDLDELQRFLGVEPRPLSSWFERLRTRPLNEVVENWDEVESTLRPTRYAPFLEDAA